MRVRDERYKWLVLLTISVGNLIAALDISVLFVSLPGLAAALNTDPAAIGWVNVVYLITSQSLMFSLARVGDAKGRKMVYTLGLAVYTLGLILCSLSQNTLHLIIFRAVQGAGAAGMISLSTAIAVAVFPENERGKAMGILASAGAIGLIAGPIMGGAVLDMLGWRAIFLSRVPIALAAMLMTVLFVKEQKDRAGAFHFDFGGAISLFCCLTTALLFLNLVGQWRPFSPLTFVLLACAVAMLAIFLRFESKADQPVIELAFFRNPVLAGAAVTGALHAAVMTGSAFLLPFYLTEALGYSASAVGLFFAMLPVPFLLLSPISGKVSDRMGPKPLSALGMVLSCVALFSLGRLGSEPTAVAIASCVCLIGASYGFLIAPNNSTIMGAVPPDRFGTASGIIAATRQIGSSTGIALMGGLFASRFAFYANCTWCAAAHTTKKTAMVSAFQDIITLAAILGTLGIVTSFIGKKRPRRAMPAEDVHLTP